MHMAYTKTDIFFLVFFTDGEIEIPAGLCGIFLVLFNF